METEVENEIVTKIRKLHDLFFPHRSASPLGFTDAVGKSRLWVYVGETDGECWYHVEDGTKIPIPERAIVGRITRIFGTVREFKGSPVYKLCLEMDCGETTYVLQSGMETAFTRGIIGALVAATPEELCGLVAVKVKTGDNQKVVFGKLFSMPEGRPIKSPAQAEYPNPKAVADAAKGICEKLGVEWTAFDYTKKRDLEKATSGLPTPHPMTSRKNGFTLIELLVVITIIAVLAGLILSAIPGIKKNSKKAASLSNLRQIGAAFHLYAGDNDFSLPGRVSDADADRWPRLLVEFLGNDPTVYAEPGDPNSFLVTGEDPLSNATNKTSYIMNGYNDIGAFEDETVVVKLNAIAHPSGTILAATQSGTGNFYMDFAEGNQNAVLNKQVYGTGSTYLFADGSARFITLEEYDDALWLVDKESDILD